MAGPQRAASPASYLQRILNARVYDVAVESPLEPAVALSARLGNTVLMKREDAQPVFSFKLRGAYNKMAHLDAAQLKRGVICASAGNHAQGVALSARRLGCRALIVMPVTTPQLKIDAVEALGGEVVLHGDSYSDAYTHALALEQRRRLTFVHPFDDPDVIAGQGTIAMEILRQHQGPIDAVFVAVGGGGLISGVASAAKAIKPDIRIVGVQSKLYPALYNLKNNLHISSGGDTLAEGIAVKHPGAISSQIILDRVDEMRIVNEAIIESAISLLLEVEKTVVEGAGAAGLATMLPTRDGNLRPEFQGKKIGIILTGGNIDSRFLANVILRNLARSGRIGRIAILLPDKVGALHEVSGIFTRHGANILEVSHQRIFGVTSAKNTVTDIEYEIRDPASLDALQADLAEAGYGFEMMAVSGGRKNVKGARG